MFRRTFIATAILLAAATTSFAQDKAWVTVKGQITMPVAKVHPAPVPVVAPPGGFPPACLPNGAPLITDDLIINAKNRGLKNVWVYLRPDTDMRDAKLDPKTDINPKLLKPAAKTHVVDQPCCQFVPRILAMREGDFLEIKNSSTMAHNTNLAADPPNPVFNKNIPIGGSFLPGVPFIAQRSPASFACNIHPWMGGKIMIFDHPYFALTDADGKFEIPDAPAGKYRIVYRHENGFHDGKKGNLGFPVTIAAGADGKTMEMKAIDINLP